MAQAHSLIYKPLSDRIMPELPGDILTSRLHCKNDLTPKLFL